MDDAAQSNSTQIRTAPRRIGGWLILPAIGVIVSPFLMLSVIVQNLEGLQQGGIFDDAEATYPGFSDLVVFETVLLVALLVFMIITAIAFFARLAYVPKLMVVYFCVHVVLSLVIAARSAQVFGGLDSVYIREIAKTSLQAIIWIPYFLVSKRVKATFVR